MSEMVERVAQAIYEIRSIQLESDRALSTKINMPAWEHAAQVSRADNIALARAAIAAMREPPESVRYAGNLKLADSRSKTTDIWQSMIDTALAEPDQPHGYSDHMR